MPGQRSDPWLRQRAWALSRDELERRSRRWYDQLMRVFESGKTVSFTQAYRTGPGIGVERAKEKRNERLACLEFAVADVVDGFDAQERRRLRESDALPDDFVERVVRQAKIVAKQIRW